MDEKKSIPFWINYFMEFLPTVGKEDADVVFDILHWEHEKKTGFLLAKRLFESRE